MIWRVQTRQPTQAERREQNVPDDMHTVWMVVDDRDHTVALLFPDVEHDPFGREAQDNAHHIAAWRWAFVGAPEGDTFGRDPGNGSEGRPA